MTTKREQLFEQLLKALDEADDPIFGLSWKADQKVIDIRRALREDLLAI